jgi:hypothetical protein
MKVTRPKVSWSPACTGTGELIRQPFRLVPFVEPRSHSSHRPSARVRSACLRDTVRSGITRSHRGSRPMVNLEGTLLSCGSPGSVNRGSRGARQAAASRADKPDTRATASVSRLLSLPGCRSEKSAASSGRLRARSATSIRRTNVSCESSPAADRSRSSAIARSRSSSDARSGNGACAIMAEVSAPERELSTQTHPGAGSRADPYPGAPATYRPGTANGHQPPRSGSCSAQHLRLAAGGGPGSGRWPWQRAVALAAGGGPGSGRVRWPIQAARCRPGSRQWLQAAKAAQSPRGRPARRLP